MPMTTPTRSVGIGQAWQAVTRTSGTTYTNTTGKPIVFSLTLNASSFAKLNVAGVDVWGASGFGDNTGQGVPSASAIIPVGAQYTYTLIGGTVRAMMELR